VNVVVEYHQPAFELLHELHHDEIRKALLTEPVSLRAEFLRAKLPSNSVLEPAQLWPIARELLDYIDEAMRQVLSKRSVFFWFHLYRRIGLALHPMHEDLTDERTLFLVRNIVDLAIQRHGDLHCPSELQLSSTLNPKLILGGYCYRGAKHVAPRKPSKFAREFSSGVKSNPQWVIRSFSAEDFIKIYGVEGLAYQYWRVTALMRTVGKGAKVSITVIAHVPLSVVTLGWGAGYLRG